MFLRLRDEAEKDIIDSADVICCTCIGASDMRLEGLKFQHVLIDEAT
jgi:regulator of nonsense transcripts 1